MSIVVEDGTGKADAETLISVADATAYHTARGNAGWNDVVELMTLDVAPPGTGWAAGNTITGATSGETCTIVERLTTLTYIVNNRSGSFTLGEVLSNGSLEADQGAANPTFAETDLQREQWLRNGTEYMVNTYRNRWQGYRTYSTVQALDWPRVGVVVEGVSVASDIVPTIPARACAELALKAKSGELQEDLERATLSEKVGPIAVTYDKSSPQAVRYKQIDSMLSPFLSGGSGGASMGLIRT
ncbi:MAG: hypothetical protein JRC86_00410 [Deltaproteobacteria bacterium]|nr:hypothetical protein [Deltaproteobacteria bacterium]